MRDFLAQVKKYEQINAVINSIDGVINTLRSVELLDIVFAEDPIVGQSNANIIPCENPIFQESVYQLLDDTYQQLPASKWVCPHKRSELVQHRENIVVEITLVETAMANIANKLSEFLSKLVKIKAQKTFFDFVSNRLDAL
jgi:hypothetical protein